MVYDRQQPDVPKKQVPLKLDEEDVSRVLSWKKRYSKQLGKGGAARILMLMGLREAERAGRLDLSLMQPDDEKATESALGHHPSGVSEKFTAKLGGMATHGADPDVGGSADDQDAGPAGKTKRGGNVPRRHGRRH